MKPFAGVLVATALVPAGCGGAIGSGEPPAAQAEDVVRPAPPIEAADEPLPPPFREEFAGLTESWDAAAGD